MAYVPRTPMQFPGDIQHDFRDYQADKARETISDWHGRAAETWLRAARLTGRQMGGRTDPITDGLTGDGLFDGRTLWVAQSHMAAYWRAHHLHDALHSKERILGPPDRDLYTCSYAGLLFRYRRYLLERIDIWYRIKPDLIELFLLAVAGEHTASGQAVEAELFYTLADLYPVPGLVTPKPLGI